MIVPGCPFLLSTLHNGSEFGVVLGIFPERGMAYVAMQSGHRGPTPIRVVEVGRKILDGYAKEIR